MTRFSPILDAILTGTRARLVDRQKKIDRAGLQTAVGRLPAPLPFLLRSPEKKPRFIAEVKRRSPSVGDLAPTADPVAVARAYEANGADALSILTEPDHFLGSLSFLADVRRALPTMPLLMKDFIIDEYQILEGRLHGADSILLIVAILDDQELQRLYQFATGLGLSVLVEVHNEAELQRARSLGARFIGVNNRNLRTMEISLEVSHRLAPLLPTDVFAISESGIHSGAEVRSLQAQGYQGFLVGSSLMADPGPRLAALRQSAGGP